MRNYNVHEADKAYGCCVAVSRMRRVAGVFRVGGEDGKGEEGGKVGENAVDILCERVESEEGSGGHVFEEIAV